MIGVLPLSQALTRVLSKWRFGQCWAHAALIALCGKASATDLKSHLKLNNARIIDAPYGEIADLSAADWSNDVVFCWNGTTSGVRVPNGDWIPDDREGLAICDATSAAFAMDLPWDKLDVVTWSWQKAMGGEAAHGMLALGPRAVERLESYTPAWPLPKVFRMTKGGKLIEGLFRGETLNTPSMLCVEDAIDALKWMESAGGGAAMVARSDASLAAVADWVAATPWVDFLPVSADIRSSTSICLKYVDPDVANMATDDLHAFSKALAGRLEAEGIAFDTNNHRDAPPSLRIWGGATVEPSDMAALLPWLDWSYHETKAALVKAA